MAKNEYNFDNFLNNTSESSKPKSAHLKNNRPDSKKDQEKEEQQKNKDTSINTTSVRIKARSGQTTPFAVQLHERDQEIIRAVCDSEGITQKHFFQYLIDEFIKGKKTQIRSAIKNYRARKRKSKNDSLLN